MDAANEERLLALIEDIAGDPVVREERDIDLFEEGLFDSMAAIELLVAIKDAFDVDIAPTEIERDDMNTVDKVIARVSERM